MMHGSTNIKVYVWLRPEAYSVPTCAKFDLQRIFWNVLLYILVYPLLWITNDVVLPQLPLQQLAL